MHWSDKLVELEACEEAVTWSRGYATSREAWAACERADWMLWIAANLAPREVVVLAACDCAETSLDFIEDGDTLTTAIFTLHIAREWAEGREDIETVIAARHAADAAYADAYAAASAYADAYAAASASAYASAYAASASAYAAASAAAYAADAYAAASASASAYAAAYAASAAARRTALKDMADLVLARIPELEAS